MPSTDHPLILEALTALSESSPRGNLRWSVEERLGVAWDHLRDVQDGQAGPESLTRSHEALDAAIAQIAFLRDRLKDLDEAQEAEALLARGFSQLEDGSFMAPKGFTTEMVGGEGGAR
jgi:hypothetical protein